MSSKGVEENLIGSPLKKNGLGCILQKNLTKQLALLEK